MFGFSASMTTGAEAGVAIGMMLFLLIFYLGIFALIITSYVMGSLGMYTIAKRRGIRKPWLAWLPVGESWIMGCISDQYQSVVKGKTTNRRKVLLILNIVYFVGFIAFMAQYVVMMIGLFSQINAVNDDDVLRMMLSHMGVFMLIWLLLFGAAIAMAVFRYIALHDLYQSCDPDNGILYLVLSIVIGAIYPFLIFVCRNKELGMPQRKEPAAPVQAPEV